MLQHVLEYQMQSRTLHKTASYPCHIHNFYSSQLSCLHMTTLQHINTSLVHLTRRTVQILLYHK